MSHPTFRRQETDHELHRFGYNHKPMPSYEEDEEDSDMPDQPTVLSRQSSSNPSSDGLGEELGFAEWKRRMAKHQAVHQALGNKVVHWLLIPVQIWGFLLLLVALSSVGVAAPGKEYSGWDVSSLTALPSLTSWLCRGAAAPMYMLISFAHGERGCHSSATVLPLTWSVVVVLVVGAMWIAADAPAGGLGAFLLVQLWVLANLFHFGFVLKMSATRDAALMVSAGYGAMLFLGALFAQVIIGHGFFEDDAADDTADNLREFRATLNPVPLLLIYWYHLVDLMMLLGYKPVLREHIEMLTHEQVPHLFRLKSE
eukprot:TRINITY_DN27987_c0_g1_i1.p1 TRINITY_DN27987_c0_g1~~TRINITY_DN27987_c0_g1_i1.p1  ORF type:complete len:312 (-),score=129.61 TRINITY_DN27987_c0_g1_i1:61-996(-)